MATENSGQTTAGSSQDLDPEVRELHERLTEVLGGGRPSGAQFDEPYWEIDSTEFQDYVAGLVDEVRRKYWTPSGGSSGAGRGTRLDHQHEVRRRAASGVGREGIMFRLVADGMPGNRAAQANAVFQLDEWNLADILDQAWEWGGRGAVTPAPGTISTAARAAFSARRLVTWDHLIYAYMIENTRALEIIRRVVWELLHGERLGMPLSPITHQWLRITERFILTDWAPFPLDLVSRVRPDLAASRRNAYYRMFGMDLNHGADGGQSYPYEKPPVSNRDFVATFEEFLRLVWRAIENETNTSGPRETDPDAIANAALRLQNMLNARRGGSANGLSLARDEFVHVTTLAWIHLTVESDNAVILDLRAGGPSEEERLRLIGERVGVPSHGRSHSYFQIARAISVLLTELELGAYSTAAGATNLYVLPAPPATNPVRDNVLRVINHWSTITGRQMKSSTVMVSRRAEIPAIAPATLPPTASLPGAVPASGNGRSPAGAGANG